jgi:hypothetical protein
MDGYKYSCKKCQYSTNVKDYLKKHNLSKRHLNIELENVYKYECLTCCKKYKNKSGLWHHNNKCRNVSLTPIIDNKENLNSLTTLPLKSSNIEIKDIFNEYKNLDQIQQSSITELNNIFKECIRVTQTNYDNTKKMLAILIERKQSTTTIINNTIHNYL